MGEFPLTRNVKKYILIKLTSYGPLASDASGPYNDAVTGGWREGKLLKLTWRLGGGGGATLPNFS